MEPGRPPSSAVSQWQHGSRAAAIGQRGATVSTITATTATTVAVSSALADAADPEAADKWKLGGNGDLDLRKSGNSTQTNNIFKGALELEKEEVWRHSLAAEYTYETSDDVTKTHKYKIEPFKNRLLSRPPGVWRTTVSYEYDLISAPYLQLDYLTGPGYRFWYDDKGKERLELIAQGGVSNLNWNDEAPVLVMFYEGYQADYPGCSPAVGLSATPV